MCSKSIPKTITIHGPCADPESFGKGPTLTCFVFVFLVDEGPDDSDTTKKAGHHWPASEMAFPWLADGGPTLNAGWAAL